MVRDKLMRISEVLKIWQVWIFREIPPFFSLQKLNKNITKGSLKTKN